jgi:hypothetical protein
MSLLRVVLGFARPDLPLGEVVRKPAQLLLLLRQGEGNAGARGHSLVFECHHQTLD